MKKILVLLLILSSCNQKQPDLRKQATAEIITTDKAMNELASSKGFYFALLKYADETVIKHSEGESPIIGKKMLEIYWSGKSEIKEITWQPNSGGASTSGDLGYTFGNWKFSTKDTVMYGNYATIWKKQKDGSWKFIYDGGSHTPEP